MALFAGIVCGGLLSPGGRLQGREVQAVGHAWLGKESSSDVEVDGWVRGPIFYYRSWILAGVGVGGCGSLFPSEFCFFPSGVAPVKQSFSVF